MHKKKNINLSFVLVVGIIITCVLPQQIKLWTNPINDFVNRPYGNSIGLTLTMILTLLLFGTFKFMKISRESIKSPLSKFLIFGLFSILFFWNNNTSLYLIGAFKYFFCLILFVLLTNHVKYENFQMAIDVGFKLSLLIQSVIGILYVFFGILIPFISGYSDTYRNDISRMTGSFNAPGDFSLYISILFIYFVSKFLIGKNKSSLKYILLSFVDIYFSGARTMLIASVVIAFYIIFKKYRHNKLLQLSTIMAFAGVIIWFLQSSIFENSFVNQSIAEMFSARLLHWEIGLKMMYANINNLLFGVGLNNHVDYIDTNYELFALLVINSKNTIINEAFIRGMPIHNTFFIIGGELGIFGLILYLRIYVKHIILALQIMKKNSQYRENCFFIIGALLVFIIYGCQGWAMLKDSALIMFVVINAFAYVMMKQGNVTNSISKKP